jgi:LysR family transcriptional regulator for metE and metH
MELEVRHLQMVSTVAAVGGLTKAGRHLHLSQSALSHQLRNVETRLGTPLFLRVGRRMVPTAAGAQLARSAQEILEALAGAEQAIQVLANGEQGRLRVRVAGHASYRWLPAVLKRYRVIHPAIDVRIPESTASDAVADLFAGAIDIAIGPGTTEEDHIHVEPLVRDEVVFAVAPTHRLAGRPFAGAADLGGDQVLVDASEHDRGVYREIIAAAGNVPANVVIAAIAATLELVQAGLGVAIVGRWVIEPQLRAGTVRAVRITRQGVWCQWNALMLKNLASAAHVRDFVALVAREMPRRARGSKERRR